MIRINTLGRTRLSVGATDFPQVVAQRRRFAVLLYVATVRHTTRDTLKAMFWADSDDDRAGRALSQSVYELRKLLGDNVLITSGNELAVGADVSIDALDLQKALDNEYFEEAIALYGGPFLQDFVLPRNSEFNSWADGVRARLARLHRVARRESCRAADARGDPQAALSIAREWVDREPNDDEAQHTYIELLARLGYPREALAHYGHYEAELEREGLKPLEDTRSLIHDLRRQLSEAHVQNATPRAHTRPQLPTTITIGSGAGVTRLFPQRRWLITFLIVIVAAVGLALYYGAPNAASLSDCTSRTSAACTGLDSAAYVVLPFASYGGSADADGFFFANAVSDVLARIEGVQIVDRMRVIDAVQRVTTSPLTRLPVDSSILLTRRLRSKHVIMGEVQLLRDSLRVVASLYDVASGTPAGRTVQLRMGIERAYADGPRQLVDSLLSRDLPAGVLHQGMALHAGREFARGEAALAGWDLPRAREHYARAAELDRDAAHPYYRLAQVMLWQRDTSSAWRDAAYRAYRLRRQLAGPDTELVVALYLQSANRVEAACDMFRRVIATDSLNFVAWYGLADCLALDNAVVPDARALSGRVFRTSHNEAIQAYERALQLAPSFNKTFRGMALSQLSRMFFINYTDFRIGRAEGSPFGVVGFPVAVGDSIGLLVFPWDSIDGKALAAANAAHTAALIRNRDRLRQLVIEWKRATPTWNAFAALAQINEKSGLIRPVGNPERSALDALRMARRYAPSDSTQIYLQAMEARLLLKLGQFAQARKVADSIARRADATTVGHVFTVASSLAVLGRVNSAAQALSTAPVLHGDAAAAALHRLSLSLLVYAAFGAPRDSIRLITDRLAGSIASLPMSESQSYRQRYLVRPAALAFHSVGATAVHGDTTSSWPIIAAQRAAAEADKQKAARILDETVRDVLGDQIEPELAFAHIALRLQLGDTATATREIDRVLGNLAAVDSRLMHSPSQSAGLLNLVMLRARLAHRAGSTEVARHWARQTLTLIAGGDVALRSTMQEMQRIAQMR